MSLPDQNIMTKQTGASMPVILIFVAMLAMVFLVGFKLYPVFFEHWQVQSVVKSFAEDPEIGDISVSEMKKRFEVRMRTNNVRDVDFDDSISIEKVDNVITIYVDYEARVNIYKNVDAVVVFKEETEITP